MYSIKPGYGNKIFAPKAIKEKTATLRYGNGCDKHNDCFTCHFADCKFMKLSNIAYKYTNKDKEDWDNYKHHILETT